MVDMDDVNREIKRLENADTTYANCEKLAMLYTVRDANTPHDPEPVMYSYASEPDASPFVTACSGANYKKLMDVLDEHMECVKVLYPKEYNLVLKKIKSLKEGA